MAGAEAKACPFCGSTDTTAFPDGSGRCGNCGRAFRGPSPVGTALHGEEVAAVRRAATREPNKLGYLGLVGGLLGYVSIPTLFLIGGALRGTGMGEYVAYVVNTPAGGLVCAGTALLLIAAWYAAWAGFHIRRGYPERAIHGIASGALLIVASALAGLGLAGIVGIVGGLLALVGGILVRRDARAEEEASHGPSAGSAG